MGLPFRPPARAADGGAPLDPGRRRVRRHGEKCGKIGNQCAQRRHRCELVILARELRPRARPWPASVGRNSAAHSAFDRCGLRKSRSLAGVSRFVNSARPVAWIHSAGNAAAKRRVGPIRRMLDQTVLDRIEMNVIEMAGEIPLVADCVLPIAALPDTAFAAAGHSRRSRFDGRQRLGERDLDRASDRGSRRRLPASSPSLTLPRSRGREEGWVGEHDSGVTRRVLVRTRRTASRSASMCLTSRSERGSSKLTVKKKVPPGTRLRR